MRAAFLSLLSACSALSVSKGLFRVDEANFERSVAPTLNLTDSRISVGFVLSHDGSAADFVLPEYAVVELYDDDRAHSQYVHTSVIQGKVFEAALPISQISPRLLANARINFSITLADSSDDTLNDQLAFGHVLVSDKLRNSVKLPESRIGVKKEIVNVFSEPQQSRPKVVILVFSLAIFACLLVLVSFWLRNSALDFALAKQNHWSVAFIGSILLLQWVIYDYFLKTDIFTTIVRVLALAVASGYSGVRSLREVYHARKIQ